LSSSSLEDLAWRCFFSRVECRCHCICSMHVHLLLRLIFGVRECVGDNSGDDGIVRMGAVWISTRFLAKWRNGLSWKFDVASGVSVNCGFLMTIRCLLRSTSFHFNSLYILGVLYSQQVLTFCRWVLLQPWSFLYVVYTTVSGRAMCNCWMRFLLGPLLIITPFWYPQSLRQNIASSAWVKYRNACHCDWECNSEEIGITDNQLMKIGNIRSEGCAFFLSFILFFLGK